MPVNPSPDAREISRAIERNLSMDDGNVADGLFAIAMAINGLARSLESVLASAEVGAALDGLAHLGENVDAVANSIEAGIERVLSAAAEA